MSLSAAAQGVRLVDNTGRERQTQLWFCARRCTGSEGQLWYCVHRHTQHIDTQGVRFGCVSVLIDVQGVMSRLSCCCVLVHVGAQVLRGRLSCGGMLVDTQGVRKGRESD